VRSIRGAGGVESGQGEQERPGDGGEVKEGQEEQTGARGGG
jgi:hypothetical protein